MNLKFNLLQKNDLDIPILKELHGFPSIKKYISISDRYFEYVVSEENVRYYKVLCDDKLIGDAKEIRVSIDNDNEKSINLFESFGFVLTETEDSLRNYIYKLK